MTLFPRFRTEPSAKAAKPAKVRLVAPDYAANYRNYRNFRGPAGRELHERAEPDDTLAQRVADIADAYAERVAIVMEVGDIDEAEARSIAEAEIGRRFVEEFIRPALTEAPSGDDAAALTACECGP